MTLTGGVWHGPKVTMERKKTGEKGKACLNRKLVLSKRESGDQEGRKPQKD